MEFEDGWLKRQMDRAAEEVASWPDWYRKRLEAEWDAYLASRPTPEEIAQRREDNRRYGNY